MKEESLNEKKMWNEAEKYLQKKETSLNECECWNIKGYGINGICLHCLNEKVLRLKNDIKVNHDWGVHHGNTDGLILISVVDKIIDEIFEEKLI